MIKFILRSAVATAVLAAAKKLYDAVVPNISTTALIRISNGIIHCSKGSISSSALRGVQRVVEEWQSQMEQSESPKLAKFVFPIRFPRQNASAFAISFLTRNLMLEYVARYAQVWWGLELF